jgi:hypothetical protein
MRRWHGSAAVLCMFLLTACHGGSAPSESSSRTSAKDGAAPTGGGGESSLLNAIRPAPLVLPEGTPLPLILQTALASDTSHEGDLVVATLASDVKVGEKTVLAAESELRGKVTAAVPAGHMKGAARLAFAFDRVVLKGQEHAIETSAVHLVGPGQKKRDIELIGGGAGAGAIIGAIAGGKKGAAIGTVLGAGAGTGAAATTRGKDVELHAGGRWTVKLTREARIG